jgi:predicted transcriptional regulator
MTKHSVIIDFDDPRAARVAEVISNKSCKRMLSLLSSKELSESELASELRLPASTVNYSMKKLVAAGLVQRTKQLWSSKGKSVPVYGVSEKHIVISPKTILTGTLPALLLSGVFALALRTWANHSVSSVTRKAENAALVVTSADNAYGGVVYSALANAPNAWAWFFLGSLVAILIVLVWNWRKHA